MCLTAFAGDSLVPPEFVSADWRVLQATMVADGGSFSLRLGNPSTQEMTIFRHVPQSPVDRLSLWLKRPGFPDKRLTGKETEAPGLLGIVDRLLEKSYDPELAAKKFYALANADERERWMNQRILLGARDTLKELISQPDKK